MLSSFSGGRFHLDEDWITSLFSDNTTDFKQLLLESSPWSLSRDGHQTGQSSPTNRKILLFSSYIASLTVSDQNPVISKSHVTLNRYFCFHDLNSLIFKVYTGDTMTRAKWDTAHNVHSTEL